jgi:hypothetical protein
MRAFCYDRDLSDVTAVDMLRSENWPDAFIAKMEAEQALDLERRRRDDEAYEDLMADLEREEAARLREEQLADFDWARNDPF